MSDDLVEASSKSIQKEQKSAREKNSIPELPSWLPASAWQAWKQHRGKKFSTKAQALALRRLETLRAEGHDPTKLIDLAIESGWVSFYPRESTRAGQQRAPGAIDRDPRSDEEIAEANERELRRFGFGEAA